jgi:hypothetical protein
MRRYFPILTLALLLVAVAATTAVAGGYRPVKGNPADRLVNEPIDEYRYDRATKCRKAPTKGADALVAWLQKNAGGSFWGIMRCEKWGKNSASLHAEGRAIDWHLNVHNSADRREAKRLINLLLAPDKLGNPHALARRMGIQEIIWDCKSWFSGSEGMRPYSRCYDEDGEEVKVDDTNAHRDHIHFGLNWPGAKKRTSFWSQR